MRKFTKKEWVCFFTDHRGDDYGFCDRCGNDYSEWTITLRMKWWGVHYKIKHWIQRNIYESCMSCGKTERIFGKEIGNHKDCLPF